MKKIVDLRTGKIKKVQGRYAKILVKLGTHAVVDDDPTPVDKVKNEYQTKVITPADVVTSDLVAKKPKGRGRRKKIDPSIGEE